MLYGLPDWSRTDAGDWIEFWLGWLTMTDTGEAGETGRKWNKPFTLRTKERGFVGEVSGEDLI